MQPYAATIERVNVPGGAAPTMRETIRRMGRAIKNASTYPPIRNHAAAIATTTPPKDFIGQLNAVYDDFTSRWRYVKDPASKELLTSSPEAIWRLTMAGDGIGVGKGKGAGDCDCAAVALGAQLEAIGFPVRLGTTVKDRRPGKLFGHVFVQAHVPGRGWVTVDPVLYPSRPFSSVAKNTRIGWWDLDGNFLGARGNYSALSGSEEENMIRPNICRWRSLGCPPAPVSIDLGWVPTSTGRISMVGRYGYLDGEQLDGMTAEIDETDDIGGGLVRTPVLELAIDDYDYVRRTGSPYPGMMALGDSGNVYYYDGLSGPFKKLTKKIKGAADKLTGGGGGNKKKKKKPKKPAKATLAPTPISQLLSKKAVSKRSPIRTGIEADKDERVSVKIGGQIADLAMKIIRPLVIQSPPSQQALKLAPIAALIPGSGPALARALKTAAAVAGKEAKTPAITRKAKGKKEQKKNVRSIRKRIETPVKVRPKGTSGTKTKGTKTGVGRQSKDDLKRRIMRSAAQRAPNRKNAGTEAEGKLHELIQSMSDGSRRTGAVSSGSRR